MIVDELKILKQLQDGDELAFKKLYDHYHQRIYALGYYLSRSETIAQDIVQDVFLKLWSKRQDLAGVQNFEAWLRTLVRNHTYNIITRSAREKVVYNQLPATQSMASPVFETLEQKEQNYLMQKAVDNLPPQQKKVYLLNKQLGLKANEIADKLNISIHTVKNHLKAATAFVKSYCAQYVEMAILLFFLTH